MDEKRLSGFNTTASFVLFSLILLASIIGMFMFVKLMGEHTEYTNNEETTTTTTTVEATTNAPSESEEESVSYVAKLSDIIGNNSIENDYSLSIDYQGTNYYFKCTNYDDIKKVCNSGLGLLQYNKTSIPLYTFSDSEKDYLTNGEDFYIIVNGNYVVFTYRENSKVYTANGEQYLELNNIITSYEVSDNKNSAINNAYPSISDNTLYYYICDTNTVFKRGLSLENKKVTTNDIIEGAVC